MISSTVPHEQKQLTNESYLNPFYQTHQEKYITLSCQRTNLFQSRARVTFRHVVSSVFVTGGHILSRKPLAAGDGSPRLLKDPVFFIVLTDVSIRFFFYPCLQTLCFRLYRLQCWLLGLLNTKKKNLEMILIKDGL